MRSVAKIALGTALGIVLAAVVIVVGGVFVVGAAVNTASKTSKTAETPSAPTVDSGNTYSDSDAASSSTPVKRRQSGATASARPHRRPAALTACDANIRVKAATTSCAFAQNVFLAYWMDRTSPGVFADTEGLPAYSHAVDKMFAVACSGDPVVCEAGDGGYVTFPISAVEAYTMADARRYAASHDTGGVDPSGGESTTATKDQPDSSSGNCDPNYAGAGLDPNSADYDCEGGTGDGPDYTGPVEIVGDDPYDLDRDGDGFACED
jgi:hypothetical protein